jgi:hypothetical protein
VVPLLWAFYGRLLLREEWWPAVVLDGAVLIVVVVLSATVAAAERRTELVSLRGAPQARRSKKGRRRREVETVDTATEGEKQRLLGPVGLAILIGLGISVGAAAMWLAIVGKVAGQG